MSKKYSLNNFDIIKRCPRIYDDHHASLKKKHEKPLDPRGMARSTALLARICPPLSLLRRIEEAWISWFSLE
jgi:hypothetical protein